MTSTGKPSIVWQASHAAPGLSPFPLKLPCGQCVGCRLERSRQWAMRCVHEAQLYKRNCFVTLTFDTAHLPEDGSLSVRDFQLFMKRLRKHAKRCRIRFFHCGEYGSQLGRPHYHACLFNWDFDDKYLWSVRDEVQLFRSPLLEKLWPYGFATVGEVTFESAAYVARYVMKKITGEAAAGHYAGKKPEYVTMSRRPGIGTGWYKKFKSDIFPHDYAIMRGHKVRPPKFYDSLYEISDPAEFRVLKSARVKRSTVLVPAWNDTLQKIQIIDDNGFDRLPVKEAVTKSRLKELRRSLEDGL